MVEQSPGVGEFDGSLQLRISPDGVITGYYRPDDNPRFIAVNGGLTGEQFWLDIGASGMHSWHFTGTFANGSIHAASSTPIVDDGKFAGLDLIGAPKRS